MLGRGCVPRQTASGRKIKEKREFARIFAGMKIIREINANQSQIKRSGKEKRRLPEGNRRLALNRSGPD
jgi:phage protein U